MPSQGLDRLRIPIRRSDLERLLAAEAELTVQEREIRERLAEERALDLGIPDMPRYGAMFEELAATPFGRRFERALWHPEEIVHERWPLNSIELARLLASIDQSVACSARTIDRLASEALIAPPMLIGEGEERPLRVYFGRHLVEIAYWQRHQFRPEVERARLDALRSVFDHARAVFWDRHPSVPRRVASRRAGR